MKGSKQQVAIWDAMRKTQKHLLVIARAGSGKTTTVVNGFAEMSSKHKCIVAFNRNIADELRQRVSNGTSACTVHSLGLRLLRDRGLAEKGLDQLKLERIYRELYGRSDGTLSNEDHQRWFDIRKIVSYAKACRLATPEEIDECLLRYDFTVENPEDAIQQAIACMEESARRTESVDFDDMIWLPLEKRLKPTKYNVLGVDETQDLNACQRELLEKFSRRFIVIGDPLQSIYAFRGADTQSIPKLERMLTNTARGLEKFPLTVTWRCPQRVVDLAREIVPDLEAAPDAVEGVLEFSSSLRAEAVVPPAMVLCRTNAPLFQEFYRLLQARIPAKIRGRDMIAEFVGLAKKALGKKKRWRNAVNAVVAYKLQVVSQMQRAGAPESAVSATEDKLDCVALTVKDAKCEADYRKRLEGMLSDDAVVECGYTLSTVHRAKGLESDRVLIIRPDIIPHPMAKSDWEKDQESNLKYVAITRAKQALYIAGEFGGGNDER